MAVQIFPARQGITTIQSMVCMFSKATHRSDDPAVSGSGKYLFLQLCVTGVHGSVRVCN